MTVGLRHPIEFPGIVHHILIPRRSRSGERQLASFAQLTGTRQHRNRRRQDRDLHGLRLHRATFVGRSELYGIAARHQELQLWLHVEAVGLIDVEVIRSVVGLFVLAEVGDDPIVFGVSTGFERVAQVVGGDRERRAGDGRLQRKSRLRVRHHTNRLHHGIGATRIRASQLNLILARFRDLRRKDGIPLTVGKNLRQHTTAQWVRAVKTLRPRRTDQPRVTVVVHAAIGRDAQTGRGVVVGCDFFIHAPLIGHRKIDIGRGVDSHRRNERRALVTLILSDHTEIKTVRDGRTSAGHLKAATAFRIDVAQLRGWGVRYGFQRRAVTPVDDVNRGRVIAIDIVEFKGQFLRATDVGGPAKRRRTHLRVGPHKLLLRRAVRTAIRRLHFDDHIEHPIGRPGVFRIESPVIFPGIVNVHGRAIPPINAHRTRAGTGPIRTVEKGRIQRAGGIKFPIETGIGNALGDDRLRHIGTAVVSVHHCQRDGDAHSGRPKGRQVGGRVRLGRRAQTAPTAKRPRVAQRRLTRTPVGEREHLVGTLARPRVGEGGHGRGIHDDLNGSLANVGRASSRQIDGPIPSAPIPIVEDPVLVLVQRGFIPVRGFQIEGHGSRDITGPILMPIQTQRSPVAQFNRRRHIERVALRLSPDRPTRGQQGHEKQSAESRHGWNQQFNPNPSIDNVSAPLWRRPRGRAHCRGCRTKRG